MEEDKEIQRLKGELRKVVSEWSTYYLFDIEFVERIPDGSYK